MLPLLWAALYTHVLNEDDLGGLYGFVDNRMSLLALEEDSLSAEQTQQWRESGVPPLTDAEIIINPLRIPQPPAEEFYMENSTDPTAVVDNTAVAPTAFRVLSCTNNQIELHLGSQFIQQSNLSITLFDLSGRTIKRWTNPALSTPATVRLSLSGISVRGRYILRVATSSHTASQPLTLQ
jgi:hypothetical protein